MSLDHLFFDDWATLVRTGVLGVCAYVALVVLLRISGKRTLSKMNAFDFLVTIALGSALATVMLSKSTSLAQGLVAFALLVGCQFVVTWLSVRWRWVRKLVTGEPGLLLYRGEFIASAMRQCRVTEDDIRAALRAAGVGDRTEVHAVVLETDASFSVIESARAGGASTLREVRGSPAPDHPREAGT
ncbi:MAG: DUF421 domain-containing protein [Pseudomonadota bacterium]|nr:DUF421 domain-containing protein [Pseudomonadota bacterium]